MWAESGVIAVDVCAIEVSMEWSREVAVPESYESR